MTTTQTTENAGADALKAEPKKNDFVLASEERVEAEAEPAKAAEAEPKKTPQEAKTETAEDEDATDQDKPQPKKRPGGWQRKIEKLEAEITALKAVGSKQTQTSETAKKPDPNTFKTYDEYVDAVADYKAETKAREIVNKTLEERQKTADAAVSQKEVAVKVEKFEQLKEESRKLHTDFDDALAEFDDVPVHPEIGKGLLDSEMGAEVAYYLAKNSEEFDKLNQPHVSKVTIQRAMAAIEAKLSSVEKKPDPVKTSKAPAPVSPVGKGKSSGPIDPETADYETYKAWRLKNKTR